MPEQTPIARRIKALREQAGLSQDALAGRADLSRDGIAKLESGARSPTVKTLRKLALALGIKEVDFFGPETISRKSKD